MPGGTSQGKSIKKGTLHLMDEYTDTFLLSLFSSQRETRISFFPFLASLWACGCCRRGIIPTRAQTIAIQTILLTDHCESLTGLWASSPLKKDTMGTKSPQKI